MHPSHSNDHTLEIFLLRFQPFFQLLLNQPSLLVSVSAFLFELEYSVIQNIVLLFQTLAAGCQVLNLFVELGGSTQGLLKLLDSVPQPLVGLLQMLASGCQVFGILVELHNLLRGFLIGFQALIEAAVSELETPIPDQPFFLRSSH